MRKNTEELQQEFVQIQHAGKASLRLFVLGFMVILLLYCGVQTFLMREIFPDFYEHPYGYLWRIAVQLLWLFPLRQLWKYRKLGKFLYLLCLGSTLYLTKDVYVYLLQEKNLQELQYLMLILAGVWRIICCTGLIRLLHNSKIRSIWSVYDMFDEELADEDVMGRAPVAVQKETPFVKKAKKRMHKNAVLLGAVLYAFIVLALILLLVLKVQMPAWKESVDIIERTLFGNFLFSAFLWMLPMAAVYMYHRSARWLAGGSLLLELIRAGFAYESYMYVYTSGLVKIPVCTLFTILELLRLAILFGWTLRLLRDPYCYYYWKRKGQASD